MKSRSHFGVSPYRHGTPIRRWAVGALVALSVCAPAVGHADPIASRWRELDEPARMAYVFGVIDGLSSAQAMFKSARAIRAQAGVTQPIVVTEALLDDALTCWIERRATSVQMFTVVERYIDANPARWGNQMGPVVVRALTAGCAE